MSFAYAPHWPGLPDTVGALATLRTGGVSLAPYDHAGGGGFNLATHVGDDAGSVAMNRARLRTLLPADPVWLQQVHGSAVVDAGRVAADETPVADAAWTDRPGVVCAVMTADCLPVLFCDTAGSVVAAAHAGWRGLAGGVLEATVAQLRARTGADLMAWLGPAIGPEHFEVGEDVRAAFAGLPGAEGAFVRHGGKYLADLFSLAQATLARCGVDRVTASGLSTAVDASRFYSYRRDGVTGRMAALAWLKG